MNKIFDSIKKNHVLEALVMVVIGLVLVVWSGATLEFVCKAIGVMLCAVGVIMVISYFLKTHNGIVGQGLFGSGIIIAVIGAWIFLNPNTVVAIIPIISGIILLINGITNLIEAVSLFRNKYDKAWLALILAVITLALALVLILQPNMVMSYLIKLIGIAIIYNGISHMWIISRLNKINKVMKQEMEAVDTEAREL
ncbi:MAG: DUF308 domain-containing protein [Butyrivibrio sp.]|nr:DUF308 domain-containing protein [Butyrivibrio sp.]